MLKDVNVIPVSSFSIIDDVNLLHSECVPDISAFEPDSEMGKVVSKLRKLLSDAVPITPQQLSNMDSIKCRVTLQALGIRIGDKVVVGGMKVRCTQMIICEFSLDTLEARGSPPSGSYLWLELQAFVGCTDV